MKQNFDESNPLGVKPIGPLLIQFAIPTIISTLLGSLYNMVDQVFIGQRIGQLGNAATTVAYPLTMLCGAVCLLISTGSAALFNINNGRGKKDTAMQYAGNGLFLLILEGILVGILVGVFSPQIVGLFGATEEVRPYALTYVRIISAGIPFLIITTGGTLLIRSDGSPKYAMFCSMLGVVANFILDYLLLFHTNMGIAGAAWATVTGQILSGLCVLAYMFRFKTSRFTRENFRIIGANVKAIVSVSAASSMNQASMLVMNLVLNNSLKYYGELAGYGGTEVLAAAGVVTKINLLFYSTIVGCSIGGQPIMGFNFGAKKYDRVIETIHKLFEYALIVGGVETLCFWLIPDQILRLFGSGAEGYKNFSIQYMHIYMLLVILSGILPVSMNALSSMGKAKRGAMISMSKQLSLIVLLLILPLSLDIKGVLLAGPVAEIFAASCAWLVLKPELRWLKENMTRTMDINIH